MKSLRILLVLCALPVHAERVVIDNLGVEAQEQSMWCWAAVSVMGIRSFKARDQFRHLSQVEVVARRLAGAIDINTAKIPSFASAIDTNKAFCEDEETKSECNAGDEPLLFDIESDSPGEGEALSMAALRSDIKLRKHPVVIRWNYVENEDAVAEDGVLLPAFDEENPMVGRHALIITGFDDQTNEVRVFDPLPVGSKDLSLHEVWMPYSQYLDPIDHEGVEVVAEHVLDLYRMRRTGKRPPAMSKYPKVAVPVRSFDPGGAGGLEPLTRLQPAIGAYAKDRVFRQSSGEARTGKITMGTPFPIVAVRARALLKSGGRVEPLLAARTPAYVVPVLEDGKVVDSFLLLRKGDGWVQGGYSNNKIASLVSRLREEKTGHGRTAEGFYLVSIPELGSYYAAHGFETKAELLTLENEARGEFAPARKVLGDLIARVEGAVAARSKANHSTRPVRPNPRD